MSNDIAREAARTIWYAVEYLTTDDFESQDPGMVTQMSQEMLLDALGDGLKPLAQYIRRYCDVLDNPEADSQIIADAIIAEMAAS